VWGWDARDMHPAMHIRKKKDVRPNKKVQSPMQGL
jgi:hypothetical protein